MLPLTKKNYNNDYISTICNQILSERMILKKVQTPPLFMFVKYFKKIFAETKKKNKYR